MPTPRSGEDWDLAEGLDPEGPSAADLDRFGGELDRCPACGLEVYDQAELCPSCGHAMERAVTSPRWVVWIAFLAAAMLLIAVLGLAHKLF